MSRPRSTLACQDGWHSLCAGVHTENLLSTPPMTECGCDCHAVERLIRSARLPTLPSNGPVDAGPSRHDFNYHGERPPDV